MEDTQRMDLELRYFRDVDKREVDFVIMEDRKPVHFIECKKSAKSANRALKYLKQRFPETKATQISLDNRIEYQDKNGIIYQSATLFFKSLV